MNTVGSWGVLTLQFSLYSLVLIYILHQYGHGVLGLLGILQKSRLELNEMQINSVQASC